MRLFRVLAVASAMLVVAIAIAVATAPEPARRVVEPTTLELRMVELVNIERRARAVPPFVMSPALSEVARDYSRLMASKGRVSHDFDGTVEDRIRRGEPDTCRFGENVSKHTSVDYSIGDLMLSAGHRGNLLNEDFTRLGVGIVKGDDGFLYITQEFATPCEPSTRRR